jgi:hypothetical protein
MLKIHPTRFPCPLKKSTIYFLNNLQYSVCYIWPAIKKYSSACNTWLDQSHPLYYYNNINFNYPYTYVYVLLKQL